MEPKIKKIKNLRQFLLNQVSGLSVEQLNTIPTSFSNNIIWNLGNLLSAQHTVCYSRAGLPAMVEERYLLPFLPGTRPEAFVAAPEIEMVKELLISTTDQLQLDYDQRRFDNYTPSAMIPKVYGFEITNIDEALEYLLYHEGYHSGCIRALMTLVQDTGNP
ncbi:DinB family protein [Niabella beijingensis]|uniref:DinB family protein n=1 Tax=Niabella beijingensis TaxID=2872700 RepID=UPI001CC063C5|nr:DinB family protein [Niabella beijingensis]MBZ4190325.1 DinB family protein [Niabella beijingensis]